MATNSNFQAACTFCSKIGPLEMWQETQQLLCKKCMVEQFENWRRLKARECYEIEGSLDVYKRKLDLINPTLNQNLEIIKSAQEAVESVYSSYIQLLNQEKNELMSTIDQLKKENTKVFDFKNELVRITQSLIMFKDSSVNLFDDNVISTLVKQFNQSNDLAQKAHQNFLALTTKPIKIIEKFEKMPTARSDIRYLGKLYTKESQLLNDPAINALTEKFQANEPFRDNNRLLQSSVRPGDDNFKIWRQRTEEMPYEEITIDRMPLHLTSFRNYLFLVDDEDTVVIYCITSANKFEYKNLYKMINFTNIRGVGANFDYFAITYSDLPKKYLKSKKYKPHGCILFKRDTPDSINMETEKILATDVIKLPIGIALNNDYAFVCDKEAKCVYKIDIRTNNVIRKVDVPNGEPYKIAINRNYMVITDPAQHHLNIYEVETLARLNNLLIEQPDGKNGPFGVTITEDNIILAKNYAESQLTLFNFNLNDIFVFRKLKPNIHGFTMMQCFNQILVIGTIEKKNQFKLIWYSNVNS